MCNASRNSERQDSFGVPKHSDFEPDCLLAKGNAKLPQIVTGSLRCAAGCGKLVRTDDPIIDWNHPSKRGNSEGGRST